MRMLFYVKRCKTEDYIKARNFRLFRPKTVFFFTNGLSGDLTVKKTDLYFHFVGFAKKTKVF